ncbi:MAG: PKD domain-containing protein [Gemmatimonadetes bacterium]|nr:MAG: PKD domain-containing protein [Gemmatimonadota bacterium]
MFTPMFRNVLVTLFLGILFIIGTPSYQEADEVPHPSLNIPYLCTFGNQSAPDWGDDDFSQTVFFAIPEEIVDSLYIRIYDPEAGGQVDEPQGMWDTQTRFSLYGGEGAYTVADARGVNPTGDYRSGTLLADTTFAEQLETDGKWIVLATVNPAQGEYADGDFIFKLIVEGIQGDDGNLYRVDCSIFPDRPTTPTEIQVFAYEWSFRMPNEKGVVLHTFPFMVMRDVTYLIHHIWDFDNDSVMYLNTPTRPGIPAYTAGNNVWAVTKYDLGVDDEHPPIPPQDDVKRWFSTTYNILEEDYESPWTFEIQKGTFRNNDVVIYVTDQNYQPLPMYSTVQPRSGKPLTLQDETFSPELFELDEDILFDQSHVVQSDVELRAGSVLPKGTTLAKGTEIPQDIRVRGGERIPAQTVLDRDVTLEEALILREDLTLKAGSVLPDETLLVHGSQVYEGLVPGEDVLPFCNTVVLDASRSQDPDGNLLSFFWDMGDGTQLQGARVVHTYREPGSYVVTVSVQDNSGAANDTDTDALTIIINEPPVAEAGTSRYSCVGETIRFDGTKSYDRDGTITQYMWYFGDGNSAEGAIVEHTYEKSGSYNVRLVVTDNSDTECNTNTDGMVVFVNEPPVANAGENIVSCEKTVRFDGRQSIDPDGVIMEYLWYFGDGAVGKGPQPTHTYEQPGVYKVKLVVLDDSPSECNTHFAEITVGINSSPVAEAGPDRTVCLGQSIFFDASGSFDPDGELFNYIWDFGDGTAPVEELSPTYTYAAPGVYHVVLTVQDNSETPCAIDTDTATITVESAPTADAGEDRLVSVGQEVHFSGERSQDPNQYPLTYKWTFGDLSDPVEGMTATHIYRKPGQYQVTLSVKNTALGPCSNDTDELTVTVNYPPEALTEGMQIGHVGQEITFDGSSSSDRDGNIVSYEWDFGDGSPVETGKIVTHPYAESGQYQAILTVRDDSGLPEGFDRDTMLVVINYPPVAKVNPSQVVCSGRVELNASGSSDPDGMIMDYQWDFGDGQTGKGAKVVHLYEQPGTYDVTLIVTDNSDTKMNQSFAKTQVTINAPPTPNIGERLQYTCVGAITSFDATASTDADGDPLTATWDFGDGNTGTGLSTTHIYQSPGRYKVIVTVDDGRGLPCSKSNISKTVLVNDLPVAVAGDDKLVNPNQEIAVNGGQSFDRDGYIKVYRWDFGDGSKPVEGVSTTHKYGEPGRYTVTLSVEDNSGLDCSMAIDQLTVTVNAPPVADAGPDIDGLCDLTVQFDGSQSVDPDGTIILYEWNFGDGSPTQTGVAPTHTYKQPGVYQVILTVTDNSGLSSGRATDVKQVSINNPPLAKIDAPSSVCPGSSFEVNAAASTDSDGQITGYFWDFGDGSPEVSGKTATHTFAKAGHYTVTLRVTDNTTGACNTTIVTKTIKANTPPVAIAGDDRVTCVKTANCALTFDGSQSYDIDGDNLSYYWNFGDGHTGKGVEVTHEYEKPGVYTVTLTVEDDTGTLCNKQMDTLQVTANAQPIIDLRKRE